MAAHLLATPTISDGVWTSEPRLPRETRSDFVRRVLRGETPESEPETPEPEAPELAGLKRGYFLLNTDRATPGTHWAGGRRAAQHDGAVRAHARQRSQTR